MSSCLNLSNPIIAKIAKEFGETTAQQLLDSNYPNSIPSSYLEFYNKFKNVKGVIAKTESNKLLSSSYGTQLSYSQTINLKKKIGNLNNQNKLKNIKEVYRLANFHQLGDRDIYTWDLQKINGNLNIDAKIERAKTRVVPTVEIQKLEEIKKKVENNQPTLFQLENDEITKSILPTNINQSILNFLNYFDFKIEDLENKLAENNLDSYEFLDLLNRVFYLDKNNIDDSLAEQFSNFLEFFLQHNSKYKEILNLAKNSGEDIKTLLKNTILNKNQKQTKLQKLINDFWIYIQELFNKNLKEINSYINDTINRIEKNDFTVLNYYENIRPNSKSKSSLSDIGTAFKKDSFAKDLILYFSKWFKLTGSIVLGEQGTVYTSDTNPFHDIDFRAEKISKEEIDKIVNAYSNSFFFRSISHSEYTTYTYIIAPKNHTISNVILVEKEKNGKIYKDVKSYDILDNNKNIVGTYRMEKVETGKITKLGNKEKTKIETETGIKAKLVDFFQTDTETENFNFKIDNHIINFASWKEIMTAKLDYKRPKDIYDLLLFNREKLKTVKGLNEDLSKIEKKVPLPTNEEINNKLRNFLNRWGIKEEVLDKLEGKGIAKAVILEKLIQIAKGKAKIDTLPEEVSHFFVALLDKESALYKYMYRNITKFAIYNKVVAEYSEQYNNNETLLKDEAIGKLIAAMILKSEGIEIGDITELQQQEFNSWWNKVWNYIKSLFLNISKQDEASLEELIAPFKQSAEQILGNDSKGLSNTNLENYGNYTMFQLDSEAQDKTLEQLEANPYFILNNKVFEKTETEGNKEIANVYEEKTKTKELVHKTIQNIISVKFNTGEARNDKNISTAVYDVLKEGVEKTLAKYGEDTKFIFNYVTIIKGKPVVIDMVAILPDGSIDLKNFDTFKTIFAKEYINGELTMNDLVKSRLNLQDVKKKLKRDNNITVRDIKLSPVKIMFDRKKVRIDRDVDAFTLGKDEYWYKEKSLTPYMKNGEISNKEEYLKAKRNPQAVKNNVRYVIINSELDEELLIERSQEEINNTKLFELQEKLNQRITSLSTSKKEEESFIYQRIKDLAKAITEILEADKYNNLVDSAWTELNGISNSLKNPNLDIDVVNDYKKTVDFYKTIREKYIKSEKVDEVKINKVIKLAEQLETIIEDITKVYYLSKGEEANIDLSEANIDEKLGSGYGSYVRNMRNISNKWIQTFVRLLDKQSWLRNKELKKFITKIQEYKDKLGDSVNQLIGTNGKLINKYNQEYENKLKEARAAKDFNWIIDNTDIKEGSKEKYDIRFAKYKEQLENNYKEEDSSISEDAQAEIDRKLIYFRQYNDLWGEYSNSAYLHSSYLQPKDKWLSDEYNKLSDDLKEFYQFWEGVINNANDVMGEKLKNNFIPVFRKDTIEKIFIDGKYSVSGMFDYLQRHDEDTIGGTYDHITEQIERTIPKYGLVPFKNKEGKIDLSKQSFDLFTVLAVFQSNVMLYENRTELEPMVQIMEDAMKSESVLEKNKGDWQKQKDTERINVNTFFDFVGASIYGIRTKEKDTTIGDNLSTTKTGDMLLDWFSKKSLVINLLSATANTVGGLSNVIFKAVSGRTFTRADVYKAFGQVSSGLLNTKVIGFKEMFDLDMEINMNKKFKSLSLSKAVQKLTRDKWYFLQLFSDKGVKDTVLFSMLNSHTLDENGKIIRKTKDQKSLFDIAAIEGDEFKLDISDEEIFNFRNKVQSEIEYVLGMSSREDLNRLKLSLMGRALMQFKNWMPNMLDARFQKLDYNYKEDRFTEGKYRTFFSDLWRFKGEALFQTVIGTATFNLVNFDDAMAKRAELQYATDLKRNPIKYANMDKAAYVEMYKENLKMQMAELRMIIGFYLIIALSNLGGDDKKRKKTSPQVKILKRAYQEISYFLDPTSFSRLVKGVMPSIGLLTDGMSLLSNSFGQGVGFVTGDDKKMDNNKPLHYTLKMLPVGNQIDYTFDLFNIGEEEAKKKHK